MEKQPQKTNYVEKTEEEQEAFSKLEFEWDTQKERGDDCPLCKDHKLNLTGCRTMYDLGLLPNGNKHHYLSKYQRKYGFGSQDLTVGPLTCHICGDFAISQEEGYSFCLKCWPNRYNVKCGTCGVIHLNKEKKSTRIKLVDQNVKDPDCERCKLKRIYTKFIESGRERYLPKGYEKIFEEVEEIKEEVKEEVKDVETQKVETITNLEENLKKNLSEIDSIQK